MASRDSRAPSSLRVEITRRSGLRAGPAGRRVRSVRGAVCKTALCPLQRCLSVPAVTGSVMLPTTEVVGVPPRWGFGPRLGNSQAGCTTSHGPMVRRLPLLQHGVVGGLAHTSLIAGGPRVRHPESEQGISHPPCGGQYRMYPASVDRFGTSLLSSVGAASVGGSRLRGRITAARPRSPLWSPRTTPIDGVTGSKRTDFETQAGRSAVVDGASDALPHAPSGVGFRAVPL